MKTRFRLPSIAFCGAVLLTLLALPARAEFKCDGRQLSRVDATACARAAQGPDSLRRFITRTEIIYGLQMRDYVRFVGDEPFPPQARVAPASQVSKPASVAGVAPPSR
jgi:hypothetical protein